MTTTLLNSAEGGTSGTTVSTSNSGGTSGTAFDTVSIGTGAAVTFDNAHSAHGSLSYKIVNGSTSANALFWWSTSLTSSTLTKAYFRAYVYLTSRNSAAIRVIRARNGTTTCGSVGFDSSGHVILADSANTVSNTSTTVVPLNQWFRLEGYVLGSGTVGQIECKIFTTSADAGSPDETVTSAATLNTNGPLNLMLFGNPTSLASFTFWMDDLAASDTAYIGPAKVSGSGSLAARKPGVSASGKEQESGSGSVAARKPSISGTGTQTISGTPQSLFGSSGGGTLVNDASSYTMGMEFVLSEDAPLTGIKFFSATGATDVPIGCAIWDISAGSIVSGTQNDSPTWIGTVGGNNWLRCGYDGSITLTAGKHYYVSILKSFQEYVYSATSHYWDTGAGASGVSNGIISAPNNASGINGQDTFHQAGPWTPPTDNFGATNYWIDVEVTPSSSGNTGTGSLAARKPSVSASGKLKISGTGSLFSAKPAIHASGSEKISGSGSLAARKPSVSASGKLRIAGTGFLAARKPSLSGSETEKISGTGSIAAAKPSIHGSSSEKISGSGSIAARKPSVAASGTEKISGSGSLASRKPAIVASGKPRTTGTGSLAARKPSVVAAGVSYFSTLRNNFEGISNGTTFTTGNSGGVSGNAFDAISIPTAGSITADNSHPGLGSIAMKMATTTTAGTPAAEWLLASLGVARTLLYFRVDCFKTASAVPGWRPLTFRTTGGTHIMSVIVSGNTVGMSYGSGFTGLTTFVTGAPNNQWFRMEGWIDTVAGTIHAELYRVQNQAVPDESHTYTGLTLGTAIQRVDVGNGNSSTSDGPFWIDEVGVSSTGPMSPASVSSRKPSVAGSGNQKFSGSGSVTARKPSISASGGETDGNITIPKPVIFGNGKITISGSGQIGSRKPSLSGVGPQHVSGQGHLSSAKPSVAAAGKLKVSGTGHISAAKPALLATGKERISGSGTLRSAKPSVSGKDQLRIAGSGSIASRKPSMSAAGSTSPRASRLFIFSPL